MATEQRVIRASNVSLLMPAPPGTPGRTTTFIDSITVGAKLANTTDQVTVDVLGGNVSFFNSNVTCTNGSPNISRGTPFINGVVGAIITGQGIPDGTTIITVTDSQHLVMSANFTGTTGLYSVFLTVQNGTGFWGSNLYGPPVAGGCVEDQWVFPNGGLALVDGTGQNLLNTTVVLGGAAVTFPRIAITYHFGATP